MSGANYPSHQQDQYVIRFPEGLRTRIKEEAARNRRSMNAEMIFHLERAYAPAAATGEVSQAKTPAAASSNNAALAGGASINQGN